MNTIQKIKDEDNDYYSDDKFAHGGNPAISFPDRNNYYTDSKGLIATLDGIIF